MAYRYDDSDEIVCSSSEWQQISVNVSDRAFSLDSIDGCRYDIVGIVNQASIQIGARSTSATLPSEHWLARVSLPWDSLGVNAFIAIQGCDDSSRVPNWCNTTAIFKLPPFHTEPLPPNVTASSSGVSANAYTDYTYHVTVEQSTLLSHLGRIRLQDSPLSVTIARTSIARIDASNLISSNGRTLITITDTPGTSTLVIDGNDASDIEINNLHNNIVVIGLTSVTIKASVLTTAINNGYSIVIIGDTTSVHIDASTLTSASYNHGCLSCVNRTINDGSCGMYSPIPSTASPLVEVLESNGVPGAAATCNGVYLHRNAVATINSTLLYVSGLNTSVTSNIVSIGYAEYINDEYEGLWSSASIEHYTVSVPGVFNLTALAGATVSGLPVFNHNSSVSTLSVICDATGDELHSEKHFKFKSSQSSDSYEEASNFFNETSMYLTGCVLSWVSFENPIDVPSRLWISSVSSSSSVHLTTRLHSYYEGNGTWPSRHIISNNNTLELLNGWPLSSSVNNTNRNEYVLITWPTYDTTLTSSQVPFTWSVIMDDGINDITIWDKNDNNQVILMPDATGTLTLPMSSTIRLGGFADGKTKERIVDIDHNDRLLLFPSYMSYQAQWGAMTNASAFASLANPSSVIPHAVCYQPTSWTATDAFDTRWNSDLVDWCQLEWDHTSCHQQCESSTVITLLQMSHYNRVPIIDTTSGMYVVLIEKYNPSDEKLSAVVDTVSSSRKAFAIFVPLQILSLLLSGISWYSKVLLVPPLWSQLLITSYTPFLWPQFSDWASADYMKYSLNALVPITSFSSQGTNCWSIQNDWIDSIIILILVFVVLLVFTIIIRCNDKCFDKVFITMTMPPMDAGRMSTVSAPSITAPAGGADAIIDHHLPCSTELARIFIWLFILMTVPFMYGILSIDGFYTSVDWPWKTKLAMSLAGISLGIVYIGMAIIGRWIWMSRENFSSSTSTFHRQNYALTSSFLAIHILVVAIPYIKAGSGGQQAIVSVIMVCGLIVNLFLEFPFWDHTMNRIPKTYQDGRHGYVRIILIVITLLEFLFGLIWLWAPLGGKVDATSVAFWFLWLIIAVVRWLILSWLTSLKHISEHPDNKGAPLAINSTSPSVTGSGLGPRFPSPPSSPGATISGPRFPASLDSLTDVGDATPAPSATPAGLSASVGIGLGLGVALPPNAHSRNISKMPPVPPPPPPRTAAPSTPDPAADDAVDPIPDQVAPDPPSAAAVSIAVSEDTDNEAKAE
jgi:hypothetical protein